MSTRPPGEHDSLATMSEGSQPAAEEDPFDSAPATSPQEQAFSEFLAELQQAEDIDPATRQQLLADLRAADPKHWPLIVHHLRATLAYRRQHTPSTEAESTAEPVVGGATDVLPQAASRGLEGSGDEQGQPVDRAADPDAGAAVAAAQADTADVAYDVGVAFASDGEEDAVEAVEAVAVETAQGGPVSPAALPEPEVEPQPEPVQLEPHRGVPFAAAEALPVPPAVPTDIAVAVYEEPADAVPFDREAGMAPPASDELSLADLSSQRLLDLAIARLEEETASPPATSAEIADHARLRLLHVAAGNQSEALRPIDGVPPSQQDFWSKQLFGLNTYLDEQAQPDMRRRASLAQKHLEDALDLLGENAVLDVRNLSFCESVRGFGIYEPLRRPSFRAGDQVKLYAEVHNYRSEQLEEGYRTLLATSYEVLDESDRRVDAGEFPHVEDLCRSRRRDFHIQYGVNLPTRIYPGKYRMQLMIEDMLSRKLGRASVEFEIVDEDPRKL